MRMKNESFYRQKIERLLLRADRAQSADALLAGMKIKKADRPAAAARPAEDGGGGADNPK